MPAAATLVTLALAALLLLAVPGPSVAYAAARTLEGGLRAGIWSVVGLETGMAVHVVAAAAGVAALVASTPEALIGLRAAGAAYLFSLGSRQLLALRRPVARHMRGAPAVVVGGPRSPVRLVRDGALVDIMNPKTGLFFLAFLPQFVDTARGPAMSQMLVLGGCVVLLAFLCDTAYVLMASGVAARLRTTDGHRRVGAATAAVYLALGVVVLLPGT